MRARWIAVARFAGVLAVAVWVAACQQPNRPRGYEFFMEDGLAREGVLARCNQDRKASGDDQECENARRAAASLAATGEHERTQRQRDHLLHDPGEAPSPDMQPIGGRYTRNQRDCQRRERHEK